MNVDVLGIQREEKSVVNLSFLILDLSPQLPSTHQRDPEREGSDRKIREREEKSVVNLSFSFRISLFFISFFGFPRDDVA